MSLGAGSDKTDSAQFNVSNKVSVSQGVPVVRKFKFAYNTTGILTGATLYTPTAGDILLDAWIEIDKAWNGTSPIADFGTFVNSHNGWWGNDWGIGLQISSSADPPDSLNLPALPPLSTIAALAAATSSTVLAVSGANINPQTTNPLTSGRSVPCVLTGASIQVVVSQNGLNNGANPGSTQGSAVLYLITVTPL